MSEVHFCALLIATTTTSINTLGCAQGEATPQQIIDVLPLEPECLNVTLSMLREMDSNFPELPSVVALFNVLPDGLKSLDVYFSDCKSLGKERAAVLNKNILFDVWYSLCRSATKAISEIKSRLDGMLPNIYDQNASVLTSLLGGAQEGLKTCTDPEGKLCIPVLPQKRRWPRYSLSEE